MSYCPECGKQVNLTDKFCKDCGCNLQLADSLSVDKTDENLPKPIGKCAEHPQRDATGTCADCGNGVCSVCRSEIAGKFYCPGCFQRLMSGPDSDPITPRSKESPSTVFSDSESHKGVTGYLLFTGLLHSRRFKTVLIGLTTAVILAVTGVLIWIYAFPCELVINIDTDVGSEGGTVSGDGSYRRFSTQVITAEPNQYYDFIGWEGEGISNVSASCTNISIGSSGRTITAKFRRYCIPSSDAHPYWEYWYRQPPYIGATGSLTLVNNESATNPSWDELEAFILSDITDTIPYDLSSYICGDYAKAIHNHAENQGIKAGFVAVFFEDQSAGHALNVFHTAEHIIYVDCTERNAIAYVKLGKEFGAVNIDELEGFNYNAYREHAETCQEYHNLMSELNRKLYELSYFYDGSCDGLTGSSAASCEYLKDQISDIRAHIKRLGDVGTCWEPMGVVEKIEVYW